MPTKQRKPGRPPLPESQKVTRVSLSFQPYEAKILRKIGGGNVRLGTERVLIAFLKAKGKVAK